MWWNKQLGHCLLSDLTPALIAELRDKLLNGKLLKEPKRSSATVVRYMAALSHSLSFAKKEWGWLDDTPMRRVTKPVESRGRIRFLGDEERKALLHACRESIFIRLLYLLSLQACDKVSL